MTELTKGKATLAIVNYKTPQCLQLCLRSIRKFTEYPYEVIVVDNDSRDESLAYAKGLDWVRVIERPAQEGENGSTAHGDGLDLALDACRTEFFVSMHTDTFVRRAKWLTELVAYFADDPRIACVGSGKIELKPKWRQWLKRATDFKAFKRKLLGTSDPLGVYRYYNRTCCCLYRTDVLKKEGLTFMLGRDVALTVGKKLYFELVDRGYRTVELPPEVMLRYVVHLAHATQAFNLDQFNLRDKTVAKCHRLAARILSMPPFSEIRTDASLDK